MPTDFHFATPQYASPIHTAPYRILNISRPAARLPRRIRKQRSEVECRYAKSAPAHAAYHVTSTMPGFRDVFLPAMMHAYFGISYRVNFK
jgi:hypothetical protein